MTLVGVKSGLVGVLGSDDAILVTAFIHIATVILICAADIGGLSYIVGNTVVLATF